MPSIDVTLHFTAAETKKFTDSLSKVFSDSNFAQIIAEQLLKARENAEGLATAQIAVDDCYPRMGAQGKAKVKRQRKRTDHRKRWRGSLRGSG